MQQSAAKNKDELILINLNSERDTLPEETLTLLSWLSVSVSCCLKTQLI